MAYVRLIPMGSLTPLQILELNLDVGIARRPVGVGLLSYASCGSTFQNSVLTDGTSTGDFPFHCEQCDQPGAPSAQQQHSGVLRLTHS